MKSLGATDTPHTQGMRLRLIEEIRKKGIVSERVLQALNTVPRHYFMDSAFAHYAYTDRAFHIDEEQTISQPSTVAFQTELLNVQLNDKILEIGTGSGYQACVLHVLGARVFTIERIQALHKKAVELWQKKLGFFRINARFGDGYEGWQSQAPFDKILITAAAPELPEKLLQQLKIGGIMVVPHGDSSKTQTMLKITKLEEEKYQIEEKGTFTFVPMLPGQEIESRFINKKF